MKRGRVTKVFSKFRRVRAEGARTCCAPELRGSISVFPRGGCRDAEGGCGTRRARPLPEASAVFSATLGREGENVERFFTETGMCQGI